MQDSFRVLIVGATGQQGSNVAQALKGKKNVQVYGLTRDLSSRKSKELVSQDVKMIACDISKKEDFEGILQSVKPNGIFLVTSPWDPKNKSSEKDMGYAMVDAVVSYCKKNNSNPKPYVIFTSAGDAEKFSDIPHLTSKLAIEGYLKQKSENNTLYDYFILRPTFFMDNFKTFSPIAYGKFEGFLKPQTKVKMISAYDIGRAAAVCFEKPKEFSNGILELTSDHKSMQECAVTFGKVWKTNVQYQRYSWVTFLMGRIFFPEIIHMFSKFEEIATPSIVMESEQKLGFHLLTVEEWAKLEFATNEDYFKRKKPILLYSVIGISVIGACVGYYYYYVYNKKK